MATAASNELEITMIGYKSQIFDDGGFDFSQNTLYPDLNKFF